MSSEVKESTNLISPHVRKSAYSYLSVEQRDNVGLYVSLRLMCFNLVLLGIFVSRGASGDHHHALVAGFDRTNFITGTAEICEHFSNFSN